MRKCFQRRKGKEKKDKKERKKEKEQKREEVEREERESSTHHSHMAYIQVVKGPCRTLEMCNGLLYILKRTEHTREHTRY